MASGIEDPPGADMDEGGCPRRVAVNVAGVDRPELSLTVAPPSQAHRSKMEYGEYLHYWNQSVINIFILSPILLRQPPVEPIKFQIFSRAEFLPVISLKIANITHMIDWLYVIGPFRCGLSITGAIRELTYFPIKDKVMSAMFGVILTWLFILNFNAHLMDAPSTALGAGGPLSIPGQ